MIGFDNIRQFLTEIVYDRNYRLFFESSYDTHIVLIFDHILWLSFNVFSNSLYYFHTVFHLKCIKT